MKVASIINHPMFTKFVYKQPPTDNHLYTDKHLHPGVPIKCEIYRHTERSWKKTGKGNVNIYFDYDNGLARIKALDERLHAKVHAYYGAGHPILPMPSDPNAFVTKLWSSTLDRNRAFFAFRFKTNLDAAIFGAIFSAGEAMADLFKTPGGRRILAKDRKDIAEGVFDVIAEKNFTLEAFDATEKKMDSLFKDDGDEDANNADNADDNTKDDAATNNDNDDNKYDSSADNHTASDDFGKENGDLASKKNGKSNYLPRINFVNRMPEPEVIIIDDSSDDDDASNDEEDNFMVDESQALASLNL